MTRADVDAQLGPATASYGHDRILAYRLHTSAAGYEVVRPPRAMSGLGWEGVDYDLVLAFDPEGVLLEHKLISVRPGAKPP